MVRVGLLRTQLVLRLEFLGSADDKGLFTAHKDELEGEQPHLNVCVQNSPSTNQFRCSQSSRDADARDQ